MLTDVSVML